VIGEEPQWEVLRKMGLGEGAQFQDPFESRITLEGGEGSPGHLCLCGYPFKTEVHR